MPQLKNAQYSPTVYNEQIAQGLRVKDTPAQFLNALYVAAGDDMYYDGLSVHEAALTAAGNNKTAVNAEYDTWDAWVTQLEKQYPVWAENFTSGTKQTNTQQAIQTLTQIFKAGDAPKDEQSSLVEQLLAQYQTAAAAYQQAGTTSNYSTAQAKVSDGWIAYLDSLAISHAPAQADHPVGVQGSSQGADMTHRPPYCPRGVTGRRGQRRTRPRRPPRRPLPHRRAQRRRAEPRGVHRQRQLPRSRHRQQAAARATRGGHSGRARPSHSTRSRSSHELATALKVKADQGQATGDSRRQRAGRQVRHPDLAEGHDDEWHWDRPGHGRQIRHDIAAVVGSDRFGSAFTDEPTPPTTKGGQANENTRHRARRRR